MPEENKTQAATPDPIAPDTKPATQGGNTSGQGSGAPVPEEVKGWSWGGFLLSWIWAIGNSVWIGLLALVPYVGFIMSIVLGIKGREWAWQAKRWESVEHFKRVQKNWTIAGLIVAVIIPVIITLLVILVLVAVNPQDKIREAQQKQLQQQQEQPSYQFNQ